MKKILLVIILIASVLSTSAQRGVLMDRFYITGSLKLGTGERAFADSTAWLEVGIDTTNKGIFFPKVLLDSIQTNKRALFVYDLQDSVLYHFDGTEKVRYLTYKDTFFIKQLIPDKAVLKDGNADGESLVMGTNDDHDVSIITNDTERINISNEGNTTVYNTEDDGYVMNVQNTYDNGGNNSALRVTLKNGSSAANFIQGWNTQAGGNERFRIDGNGVLYNKSIQFNTAGDIRNANRIYWANDGDGYITAPADGTFSIATNNTERIKAFPTGNVSIGGVVADNGYRLDVDGHSRFSGDGDYNVEIGNSLSISRKSNGRSIYRLSTNGDYSARFDLYDNNNNVITRLSGGTPSYMLTSFSLGSELYEGYKLDVTGATRLKNTVTLNESLYFYNTNQGIYLNSHPYAGKCINIGYYTGTYQSDHIKIGYYLSGTTEDKRFLINQGYYNNMSHANHYATVIGTQNIMDTSDTYCQIVGSYNYLKYVPNTVSLGNSIYGSNDSLTHQYSTIIGVNQATTETNQLILAQSHPNISQGGYNKIYFGTGPRSRQQYSNGSNIVINGSGAGYATDKTGGSVTLAAGRSTGAGLSPDLVFATATPTTSGSSLQSLTNRWYIKGGTGYLSNQISPTSFLDITGTNGYSQLRLRTSYTPSSTSDTNGETGDIAWDNDYLYIKTSAGWKRTPLSNF